MKYKNSVAIIRTREKHTAGCHMIFTDAYWKSNPTQFDYKEYRCDSFELLNGVDGSLIVKTYSKFKHASFEAVNIIKFLNVAAIEMLTEHEI